MARQDGRIERALIPRHRLLALFAGLLALLAIGKFTGFVDRIDPQQIRDVIVSTGPAGWLVYVGIFVGGQFMHIPGMVFVVAGILVYGDWLGFGLAFFASLIAISVSFAVVRLVGGSPLGTVRSPFLQRVLDHLDARPIRSVTLLRLVFWLNPLVNTALALTPLRFRDYLIGSALGLLGPVALVTVLLDWFLSVM